MSAGTYVLWLVQSGLGGVASYLAAHVLLCLLPAFFIAGAMSALVPRETVTRLLGRDARPWVAYLAATLAGSVLAVCSCTILPLFAGILRMGAGLGPAITFLFFAPASNILALAYTGATLGGEFLVARLVLSLLFAVGIGMIMALIFRRDGGGGAIRAAAPATGAGGFVRGPAVFLALLVVLLLAGTFKIPVLVNSLAAFTVSMPGAPSAQAFLDRAVPFNAARGEEGISVQGVLLIALLVVLGLAAWRTFRNGLPATGRLPVFPLALVTATLVFAALPVEACPGGLAVRLTGRTVAVAAALAAIWAAGWRLLSQDAKTQWLEETWRFAAMILPLLVLGVFGVGVIRSLMPPEWVRAVAGSNTVTANLAGVVFGVFMYFPTLVEVPVAKMFLSLGMHKGPLLAYLMADPELSLQSVIILVKLIGRARALTYVGWVALFSTVAGLMYGAWTDGADVLHLAGGLAVFAVLLAVGLTVLSRHSSTCSDGGTR